MKFVVFYKKYIEPFIAVAVLIMVCILVAKLSAYNNFQKEISENCGWGTEDTRCYCEKGDVIAWENNVKIEFEDINLSLVGDDNG